MQRAVVAADGTTQEVLLVATVLEMEVPDQMDREQMQLKIVVAVVEVARLLVAMVARVVQEL
jgi:hypothetical protein